MDESEEVCVWLMLHFVADQTGLAKEGVADVRVYPDVT